MNLLPEASAGASQVDWLLASLLAISIAVMALVFSLMLFYVVRYRHDSKIDRGALAQKTWRIETVWTIATLIAFFGLFIWGANMFANEARPHANALTINVIGKQWMWKVEYPAGQREINALHLPVDRDVELLLTSEDVIHDFGLPEFRVKHDVLPGRYEALWLHPTRIGRYHLFCDQFCGTDHASMIGTVFVMSAPGIHQRWLVQYHNSEDMVAQGDALFVRYGCSGCHHTEHSGGGGTERAPSLSGVYMSPVPLSDGSTVIGDDRYLRDSILHPNEQVVASYAPVMPSYDKVIGEEDLMKIIAYIQSLAPRVSQARQP